jgi:hypothetical protein
LTSHHRRTSPRLTYPSLPWEFFCDSALSRAR